MSDGVGASNQVLVRHGIDSATFRDILSYDVPVLMKDCNFGPCTVAWTREYLKSKIDNELTVSIHESTEKELNFIEKNFKYKICKMSEFLDKLLDPDLNVYLRSTNRDPRAKKPARIEDDFPMLANDLKPPEFVPYGGENTLYHSSVLRIASSGIQIWTHFDLYDNVLLQIVGTKRVILIPPSDSKYLYVRGDKSPVNEFDDWQRCLENYPLVRHAKLYRCLLEPGDCLFIPSLWWHNIRTLDHPNGESSSASYSIGLNIFWRDQNILPFYAGNDVYGNKNLVPFEVALSHLDKFLRQLNKLPGKYISLYKAIAIEKINRELSEETTAGQA